MADKTPLPDESRLEEWRAAARKLQAQEAPPVVTFPGVAKAAEVTGVDPSQPLSPLDVVSGAGRAFDSVTGAPVRAAVGALHEGQSPVEAYRRQFAENPELAPSGEDIARMGGVAEGGSGIIGAGLDMALDPTNLIPGKAALSGLVAAGALKKTGKAAKVLKGLEEAGKVAKGAEEALDMSHAARRARIANEYHMDPDKLFYHGTKADIDAFDPAALGASTKAGSARLGYFFATDPSTAADYSRLSKGRAALRNSAEEGRALADFDALHEAMVQKYGKTEMNFGKGPVTGWREKATPEELGRYNDIVGRMQALSKERAANNIELEGRVTKALKEDPEFQAAEKKYNALSKLREPALTRLERAIKKFGVGSKEALEAEDGYNLALDNLLAAGKELAPIQTGLIEGIRHEGSNVLPVHLRTENPYTHDFKGKDYRDEKYADIMKKAKEAGHDSVIFKNTYDPADPENRVLQDIVAVFDPSQIRSKFAKFDPKKIKSSDISAGVGGAALGAGALGAKESEASEPKGYAGGGIVTPDAQSGTLIIDPYGMYRYIDPTQAQEAVTTGGYTLPTPEQTKEFGLKQEHGSSPLTAFAESAAGTATFGASRALERGLGVSPEAMAAREKYNPVASGLGSAAGVVGPLLMPEVGLLGAVSAPVKGVAKLGQATAEAVLPGATRIAGALTGKPALQKITAQAASQGLGSAVEAAFYGAGQSVNEAALGDPGLNAEKVMSNIGLSALLGGGAGALLGAGVGALAKPEVKAGLEARQEMAAKAAAEAAEGLPKAPPGTLDEIQQRIEAGKFKYPGTDMPAMGDVTDASTRVTDLDFPVNNVQIEALKSPEAHTFIKTMQETGEGAGPMLNEYEALQKRELVSKLNHDAVTIAPGHAVTADPVASAGRISRVAAEQIKAEQAALAPIFKQVDEVATANISSPIEIVEAIGRAIPKAEKFIQVIPKEGEAAVYKLKPYDIDMGISRKVYGAVDDMLRTVSKPDQTIAGLRNARETLRAVVSKVDDASEIAQIGGLRRELMTYIGEQINKVAPELNVRETFKRYAVNEEKRAVLESIFGGSLKEGATFAKKAVPEEVLNRIFQDTVNVQAVKDLLGPEEFNKVLGDYVAFKLHAASDGQAFYSNKFGKFLKDKSPELQVAFDQYPDKLQRLKDLTMLARRLPDAPKANPSGTAKVLNVLQKIKQYSEAVKSGGLYGGITGTFAKAGAAKLETLQNDMMIKEMLAGKGLKEAQDAAQFGAMRNLESTFKKGQRLLTSGAKSVFEGGKTSAVPLAAYTGSKLATQEGQQQNKDMQAKLRQLQADPNHLMDTLDNATKQVYAHAPQLAGALSQSAATAVSYLASKLPEMPPPKPLSPKLEPNKAEMAQFQHYVDVINNPMGALNEVKAGTITPATVETLQTVYPKLYTEMKSRVMEEMTNYLKKGTPLPYAKKASLSIFMGMDMDYSFDQRSIASNQMALQPQQPGPRSGGAVNPSQKGLSSITKSERMKTPVQAVQSGTSE